MHHDVRLRRAQGAQRSKHIDLRIWSLKDQVAAGAIRLMPYPTAHTHADIFTKSLSPWTFALHRDVLFGELSLSLSLPAV